jgi:hypothetical protein
MVGYDPNFLDGIHLPLPQFFNTMTGQIAEAMALREGIYVDYIHYTVSQTLMADAGLCGIK